MAGDFDSIKIGVCDCFWTPVGTSTEMFLGLTKGGVELSYTPEWHEITVDQYGKTPVDSVLLGETVQVKVPLAETDMNKLKMFAPTATWNDDNKKLTFGRFPGMRLGEKAGILRLHPIAMGDNITEDVTIYKAVNKAPLQLNYKIDDERLFQCEFHGMIKRGHENGSFLFEIGDSSTKLGGLKPDNSNLEQLVQASGGDFYINPTTIPMLYGTADIGNNKPNSVLLDLTTIYNFNTYNITSNAVYTKQNPVLGSTGVLNGASPADVLTLELSSGKPTGRITAVDSATLKTFTVNGTNLTDGDVITAPLQLKYAGQTKTVIIKITV